MASQRIHPGSPAPGTSPSEGLPGAAPKLADMAPPISFLRDKSSVTVPSMAPNSPGVRHLLRSEHPKVTWAHLKSRRPIYSMPCWTRGLWTLKKARQEAPQTAPCSWAWGGALVPTARKKPVRTHPGKEGPLWTVLRAAERPILRPRSSHSRVCSWTSASIWEEHLRGSGGEATWGQGYWGPASAAPKPGASADSSSCVRVKLLQLCPTLYYEL